MSALLRPRFFQEEGVCDDIPEDAGGGQEFDPSDGTATPGSTGRQRILPSGANAEDADPDCGKAAELLNGLQQVRDAYASTAPRAGESGPDRAVPPDKINGPPPKSGA